MFQKANLAAAWAATALLGGLMFITAGGAALAQTSSGLFIQYSRPSLSKPLRDLPRAKPPQGPWLRSAPRLRPPPPRAAPAQGATAGPVLQAQPGPQVPIQPGMSFSGIGHDGRMPPDANIAVGKFSGKTYIAQVVNAEIAVYDTSNLTMPVLGPIEINGLFSGEGGDCAQSNVTDPIVQYDNLADNGGGRWVITYLDWTDYPYSKHYSECIAVSLTADPGDLYNLYNWGFHSYTFGDILIDYPKFGVWPTATNSAYLGSYNPYFEISGKQTPLGSLLCAYDRTAMLSGKKGSQICKFINLFGKYFPPSYLPSDLDGANPPPSGSPGYFVGFDPSCIPNSSCALRLYALSPNFADPSSSTLTHTEITIAPFNEACAGSGSWVCIPQPNTDQELDAQGWRPMYRLAYRNYGSSGIGGEAMVFNHSVGVGSSVGVRWYELTAPASQPGQFSLAQQGTFAPDSAYRWMGSAAMDGAGDIALGYSESMGSTDPHPSVAVTAHTPSMPSGVMGAETLLQCGSAACGQGSQANCTGKYGKNAADRWGDYTSLRIDPSDDMTFWYTNEYYKAGDNGTCNWSTVIGSFKVSQPPPPTAFSVLHEFAGSPSDGAGSLSRLVFGGDGALYGTTVNGGDATCNCGTVFRLSPPATLGGVWTETVLYSFQGSGDGFGPSAGVVFDKAGVVYGTTEYGGGTGCAIGCGTVFKLSPPATAGGTWTETVLYSFGSGSDGYWPRSGLVLGGDGALYGTTWYGGSSGDGTVFQLSPPAQAGGTWTESILHSFTGGSDGREPLAGLVFDGTGALYGTTALGGSMGSGTVFKLSPPVTAGGTWTETVLYSFCSLSNCSDGEVPYGDVVFDSAGALYGTTIWGGEACNTGSGCGTVFKLSPPAAAGGQWTESVLHSFTDGADGGWPMAGLVFDSAGALYGTTDFGGGGGCSTADSCGTVFQLSPPTTKGGNWTESVLYKFCSLSGCSDGGYPQAGLVFDAAGALYGTAAGGGSADYGTVFQLSPPPTLSAQPLAGLTQ